MRTVRSGGGHLPAEQKPRKVRFMKRLPEEPRPTPKSRGPQCSELCIFPDKPVPTPVYSQETTTPAHLSAEERGRRLARAKYQTAQNREWKLNDGQVSKNSLLGKQRR